MIAHLLRIAGATAFILLCTILPFLPGRYDSLAVPLSMLDRGRGHNAVHDARQTHWKYFWFD